eukprot:sb/3462572/
MSQWSEGVVNGAHYWYDYEGGAMCALITPEHDCKSRGDKRLKVKCAACKTVIHYDCTGDLSVKCRATFRESNHKKEQWTPHHWVLLRKGFGTKCRACNKTVPRGTASCWVPGSGKSNKSFVAVYCSWCKDIYHTSCFQLTLIEDHCSLGEFESVVVPPNWVVYRCNKKPDKRKISYSTRPSKRGTHHRKKDHEHHQDQTAVKRAFHIKPMSTGQSIKTPLIVFVNPKSGGNEGVMLMRTFQWFLNPRQVFDLTEGGPTMGLQLYQNVPNLRILCCGGDGTVGWVLSEMDKLNFITLPPVAILPLGTGNDLARVLNWGAAYAGEPIEKILWQVSEAAVQCLDRWEISVENTETELFTPTSPILDDGPTGSTPTGSTPTGSTDQDLSVVAPEQAGTKLPINIFNNYFGIGLDAHIQYQFHTGREAKPEKYNSRVYNKFVYFKGGLFDTFEQKYKNLSKYLELTCDGVDFTDRIREQKIHCIVFLNIRSYSGGANPWGSHISSGMRPAHMGDGYIEVVGLFSAPKMAAMQVGLTGYRICQCRKAVIKLKKAMHCQVDGEPCYIVPSVMKVNRRNQCKMLIRWKSREGRGNSSSVAESSSTVDPPSIPEHPPHSSTSSSDISNTPIKVAIHKVSCADFQHHHGDLNELSNVALPLSMVIVNPNASLESIRPTIVKCVNQDNSATGLVLSDHWVYLHRARDRLIPISAEMEG